MPPILPPFLPLDFYCFIQWHWDSILVPAAMSLRLLCRSCSDVAQAIMSLPLWCCSRSYTPTTPIIAPNPTLFLILLCSCWKGHKKTGLFWLEESRKPIFIEPTRADFGVPNFYYEQNIFRLQKYKYRIFVIWYFFAFGIVIVPLLFAELWSRCPHQSRTQRIWQKIGMFWNQVFPIWSSR